VLWAAASSSFRHGVRQQQHQHFGQVFSPIDYFGPFIIPLCRHATPDTSPRLVPATVDAAPDRILDGFTRYCARRLLSLAISTIRRATILEINNDFDRNFILSHESPFSLLRISTEIRNILTPIRHFIHAIISTVPYAFRMTPLKLLFHIASRHNISTLLHCCSTGYTSFWFQRRYRVIDLYHIYLMIIEASIKYTSIDTTLSITKFQIYSYKYWRSFSFVSPAYKKTKYWLAIITSLSLLTDVEETDFTSFNVSLIDLGKNNSHITARCYTRILSISNTLTSTHYHSNLAISLLYISRWITLPHIGHT
jgi:hypothetical protein